MKKSLIHRIFGKEETISRDDLETYGSSDNDSVKQAIEEKSLSSEFDSDAMEGWEELGYDTSVMDRLDKKFVGGNTTVMLLSIAGIIIVGISVFLLLYDFSNHAEQSQLAENPTEEPKGNSGHESLSVEEEDILLDESIEKMQEAETEQQVHPKTISEEFVRIDSFNKVNPLPPADYALDNLPVDEIETDQNTQIKRNKISANEIYLHDLKLVDYRVYRSKPEIHTKQLVLTGTPANMEDRGTDETEAEWKDVQIPYIEYIDKSMRVFSKNNYKKSLSRFETILNTYPDDINALFYGGLCLFNLGEYEQAIDYFSKCRSTGYSNFDEEARWLIGLCYENSGKTDKANEIFIAIREQGGFYADQAAKKLKK